MDTLIRWELIKTLATRVAEKRVNPTELCRFAQLVFDLSSTCDWETFDRCIPILIQYTEKQLSENHLPAISPLHALNYANNGMSRAMMRQIAQAYAKHDKDKAFRISKVGSYNADFHVWKQTLISFDGAHGSDRRIRLGYISSDFVNHPTSDLIQSTILEHDTAKFEIFCYSISREDNSECRKNLKEGVEHFQHFPQRMSDRMCAEIIAKDGIVRQQAHSTRKL